MENLKKRLICVDYLGTNNDGNNPRCNSSDALVDEEDAFKELGDLKCEFKGKGEELNIEEAERIIDNKACQEIEQRNDCKIFKNRCIGKTIREFWQSSPCGRYFRGEPTKKEFDEHNCDM